MKFEFLSKEMQQKELSYLDNPAFLYKSSVSDFINQMSLPKRATKNSAGYDFVLPCNVEIVPMQTVIIPTFVKVKLDDDKILSLYPRSSYGIKKNLIIANTVGIIDADYYNNPDNEGHILIAIRNLGNIIQTLRQGDKFAQGIITRFYCVNDDNVNTIRTGGIGSSDK